MSTTSKIVIGIGIASGALLAAWLLTGSRKEKTKEFISRKTNGLKKTASKQWEEAQKKDSEVYNL